MVITFGSDPNNPSSNPGGTFTSIFFASILPKGFFFGPNLKDMMTYERGKLGTFLQVHSPQVIGTNILELGGVQDVTSFNSLLWWSQF